MQLYTDEQVEKIVDRLLNGLRRRQLKYRVVWTLPGGYAHKTEDMPYEWASEISNELDRMGIVNSIRVA